MPRPESTLPQMPDYSFKAPQVSTGPAEIALQRQAQQQQQNQQSFNNILQTTKMASELAQTFVELSKQRQQKDAIKAYFAMKDPNSPIQRIALANPQQASQDIMSAAYPKINSLSALATQGILTGNQGQVDQATKAEQQMKTPPSTQKQMVLLDKKPQPVNYVPGRGTTPGYYSDDNGVKIDSTRIQPIPSSGSEVAGVRRAALIDKMNNGLAKTMQPANWTGNTPAATAAKLVVNADSAKALADQMLSGQIPKSKQAMSILNTDVARVIGQQGVVTNEARQELQAKTGKSSFADALSYFTNNPEDEHTEAFVQVLRKEMDRQQQLRQRVVDSTMASNLSAHQELRKLDSAAWEQGLTANGIDVEAAKNGHFKLRPDFVSSLQPTQDNTSTHSGITIDHSALDAELRKRGL